MVPGHRSLEGTQAISVPAPARRQRVLTSATGLFSGPADPEGAAP